MSATLLAVSTRYEVPAVLAAIANDTERPELENRQRMGISLADVERWGLGFRSLEDGIVYLGMGAHFHERTAPLTLRVLDEYRLWNHPYFARLRSRRGLVEAARALGIVRPLARRYQRSVDARINEEVNLYTYRTPDYLLRCVQDQVAPGAEDRYVWQATLGPGAVVSTNPIEGARLAAPRAVAYRNIVICLYRDGAACRFPRQAFDEVREASGWVLARRADGYVAVRSGRPYTWQDSGGGSDQLIVSAGPVAWICICGRAYTHESFDRFVDSVTGARVEFGRGQADRVEIDIAPHGLVAFGRRGPLAVGGRQITVTAHLHDSPYPAAEGYRRFDNPYVSAEFPANIVRVRCADEQLSLNWRDQARSASSFL